MRVIAGILLFLIGFPIAVAASVFSVIGWILGSISGSLRELFIRLCELEDK